MKAEVTKYLILSGTQSPLGKGFSHQTCPSCGSREMGRGADLNTAEREMEAEMAGEEGI